MVNTQAKLLEIAQSVQLSSCKAARQRWTRHESPSLSPALSDVQLIFFLGTSISAKKLVSVLEKREGLGKDLAQVIDAVGKQNYAREEELGLPLCHFCC